MTRMPESRSVMPSFTCRNPVTAPAAQPHTNAQASAATGWTPAAISAAVTHAPSGNVPSTDKSGKCSTR